MISTAVRIWELGLTAPSGSRGIRGAASSAFQRAPHTVPTHEHVCMLTHMPCTHTHTCTPTYAHTHTHKHVTHLFTSVHRHTYTHRLMCAWSHAYTCLCAHMCSHIHLHDTCTTTHLNGSVFMLTGTITHVRFHTPMY